MKFRVLFLLLCILIGSNDLIFASQNDFLGVWSGNINVANRLVEINITISNLNISCEFNFPLFGQLIIERENFEIISWLELNNNDEITKNEYPNGYTLSTINKNGFVSTLNVFISINKEHIIILSEGAILNGLNDSFFSNENIETIMVLKKIKNK